MQRENDHANEKKRKELQDLEQLISQNKGKTRGTSAEIEQLDYKLKEHISCIDESFSIENQSLGLLRNRFKGLQITLGALNEDMRQLEKSRDYLKKELADLEEQNSTSPKAKRLKLR